MKKTLYFIFVFLHAISALDKFDSYIQILNQLEESCGKFSNGEIEIVTDPKEIEAIEKIQEDRLTKSGVSSDKAKSSSKVGIIFEDRYWMLLRDAVRFPSQISGTYNRLLWKNQLQNKYPGIAVLPLTSDGKILLILTFRHATRSWELEIPRGGIEANETPIQAAIRELQEETGFSTGKISFLGEMAVDSGTLGSVIPIFVANLSSQESSSTEDAEAISGTIFFSLEEIQQGLVEGYLKVPMQDGQKNVPLRDPFLTFAILQMKIRNLL